MWTYFPHTAAMCTLIALAVCNGPLLYDFTIIYKVTIMLLSLVLEANMQAAVKV